jgi:hypothetical protein
MVAFATEDRVQLQRLGVSLAVALALHGAIAIALLNWGRAIFAVNPIAPLVINIDLAPLVGVPASSPNEPAPTPSASERVITDVPPSGLEPAASPIPTPAAPGNENAAAGGSTSGGAGSSRVAPEPGRGGASAVEPAAPAGTLMNTPLDTSITVMPDLYKKGGGGFGQKKKQGVFFRPLRQPGLVGQPERPGHVAQPERPHNVNPGSTTTNAVGARVQDRARAALAREAARAGARNAIGGIAAPGIVGGGAGANAPEAVTKNAIGMTVPVHPNVPGTSTAIEPKAGSLVATGNGASHAAIGAHDMIRPAAAGGIGGPARSRPGVLSGSDFHSRHP